MRPLILLLLAATVLAEKDPYRLKPDHAKTPYTAAQIREGCSDGRVSTFEVVVSGRPKMAQKFHFKEGNEEGCALEVTAMSTEGKPLAPSRTSRNKWVALQSHASYPEANTKIETGRIETPAGAFDCLVYTVTAGPSVRKFHFAKDLPGPPVQMTAHNNGQLVMSMTLVAHENPGRALRRLGVTDDAGAAFDKLDATKIPDYLRRQIDADKDGTVTRDEFVAQCGRWTKK